MNKNIIKQFEELIIYTEHEIKTQSGKDKITNQFRLKQFKKALETIKQAKFEIKSGDEAKNIEIDGSIKNNGIGKGIISRIDEILKTGKLLEIKNIHYDKKAEIIQELCTVTGIGEVHALDFFNNGITSVQNLIDIYLGITSEPNIKLTHHMQIGLKYYSDINERIQRSEMEKIDKKLKKILNTFSNNLIIEICGSYRRGKDTSGDIDVLIARKNEKTYPSLSEIIKVLHDEKFIVDDLTLNGDTKYMGICKYNYLKSKGRRIDIRYIKYEHFYPALLYFTGSMELNKIMRQTALKKGYILNEYELLHKDKGSIKITSEKDIFNELGMDYLNPIDR